MKFEDLKETFSVEEAVKTRYSVRTFDKRPAEKEIKEKILAYAKSLHNPLGPKMKLQFIEKNLAPNGEKLGTYGIIKGANLYVGVTIPKDEHALEALGYEFEQLVLYATSIGLGTCWLGGTFNRSAFASAMEIGEEEIFPILSPLGYPAKKKSFTEQIMRKSIKADGRMDWNSLFFKDNFDKPLAREEAREYCFPLEMVRLAPSAVNKQPWRAVVTESAVHFFEKHSMQVEEGHIDMQRIDVGIAMNHFHIAVLEKGIEGRFERIMPEFPVPGDMTYIASWVKEL